MGNKDVYRQAAETLGRELVNRGLRLVYGAGSVGLMGVLARTVYERGGDVLGIIPDVLAPREVAGESIGETIIVENMHCLLYTSPSPRDRTRSRMPSSA